VPTLPVPPVLLHRHQWSPNEYGLVLQSNGHNYHVTRELVGESDRVSVQAAVMLAERWTTLTGEEINHFLAGEDGADEHASANVR
jgi:hypothetical protein